MDRCGFYLGAMLVLMLVLVLVLSPPAFPEPIRATLYKNPQCSCCEDYAAYLRRHGFEIAVRVTNDLAEIGSKAGVPEKFQGATRCSWPATSWTATCR